jgi:hypothetical protein
MVGENRLFCPSVLEATCLTRWWEGFNVERSNVLIFFIRKLKGGLNE